MTTRPMCDVSGVSVELDAARQRAADHLLAVGKLEGLEAVEVVDPLLQQHDRAAVARDRRGLERLVE